MSRFGSSTIRAIIGWVVVFALRLIPFRVPNIEGVMGTLMPVSKRFGYFGAFLYAVASIALYDWYTGYLGSWTVLTALSYGVIGLWSTAYFRRNATEKKHFVLFSIYATLAYDFVTGVLGGPLMFGQSFMSAFIGQIPFTLYHLGGNIIVAALVSPLFLRFVVLNPRLEFARKPVAA